MRKVNWEVRLLGVPQSIRYVAHTNFILGAFIYYFINVTNVYFVGAWTIGSAVVASTCRLWLDHVGGG